VGVDILAATALEHRLLPAGAILMLAVVAAVAARRLRLPVLISFLGLGMLLGSEGLGGIYFDDAQLARTIGILALIAILFEGGLTTEWPQIRPIFVPAFLLSTLGVFVTAAVTGLAAYYLFDVSKVGALLLGAVVGSTDAAAVFATLRFTPLRHRLAALLNAESGANDPTAVALTIGLITWLTKPNYGAVDVILLVVRQLTIGLFVGVALGWLASRTFPRLTGDLAPFAPLASVATAALAYGAADTLHGSGFLAVYEVGVWLGNTPMPLRRTVLTFHEGLAFTAQAVLFIVLGLLVFPSQLGPVAAASLGLAAVLLFVARPIAVFLCTPTRALNLSERVFVAWAGLRGAVPIVLATFALSAKVEESTTIFNAVFFVVIVSALAQGLTLEPLARWLRLTSDAQPPFERPVEPDAIRALGGEILEFEAGAAGLAGRHVRDLGLPPSAVVMLVVRDGAGVAPRGDTRLARGDHVYVFVSGEDEEEVAGLLRARD
jgi:cell volume regulation protein A